MDERELYVTIEMMQVLTTQLESHYEFLMACKSDDNSALLNLYKTRNRMNSILKNLYSAEKDLIEYSIEYCEVDKQ